MSPVLAVAPMVEFDVVVKPEREVGRAKSISCMTLETEPVEETSSLTDEEEEGTAELLENQVPLSPSGNATQPAKNAVLNESAAVSEHLVRAGLELEEDTASHEEGNSSTTDLAEQTKDAQIGLHQ